MVEFSTTKTKLFSFLLPKMLCIAIVVLGLFLRTININWDENQHLHPDERFLTMVMGNMVIPRTLKVYLNPDYSPLNPVNVGYEFFVYGTLPLIINKIFAVALNLDDYNNLTLLGRSLSAIMDAVGVGLVILIARELETKYRFNRNIKYFAGFFYAISVFPIQQAHFFTVDTFANTFFLFGVLFALKTTHRSFLLSSIFSGACLALAVACKINLLLAGPLVGCLAVEECFVQIIKGPRRVKIFLTFLLISLLWLVSFWVTLRFSGPYYFSHFSLIDLKFNAAFVKNIESLKSLSDPKGYFPPGIQWGSKKPIIFPLVNIAIYGLGLPLFFFSMFGFGKLILFALSGWKRRLGLVALIGWVIVFFIYQGSQFVLTMRYFLFLYPFLAFFAAYGVIELGERTIRKISINRAHHQKVVLFCTLLCVIWPLLFISIYIHRNTRVEASVWMYKVLPTNSMIAMEHWDDPLPLSIENANQEQKIFEGKQLPVFYEDVDVKWKEMSDILTEADYYVLTSNRGWGSIMADSNKYPKMSQFYQQLFDEQTEFTKIKEFTSYPSLQYLGIPFTLNDDWAEEAFTVYDHPKVMIYAKRK